jgi:hypothetical protein
MQDLATVEGEITLARSDLHRCRDVLEFGKDQLTRSKGLTAKSVSELHRQYLIADELVKVEQRNRESTEHLEQLESRKKLLVEYTKPKRLKQLQSEVEKARAAELANQAEWELAKAREIRLEKLIQREDPNIDKERIRALIARAIPIEEQIGEKLAQFAKAEKTLDPLHKEIQDLTNELRTIVDEGEAVWSAGEFSGLKNRIQQATRQGSPAGEK